MNVIAIDFDGTASNFPEKVRTLYEQKDNVIIIYTARPACMYNETVAELEELNIPYHALVTDKLRADIYIDDRNCGGLTWPV